MLNKDPLDPSDGKDDGLLRKVQQHTAYKSSPYLAFHSLEVDVDKECWMGC